MTQHINDTDIYITIFYLHNNKAENINKPHI